MFSYIYNIFCYLDSPSVSFFTSYCCNLSNSALNYSYFLFLYMFLLLIFFYMFIFYFFTHNTCNIEYNNYWFISEEHCLRSVDGIFNWKFGIIRLLSQPRSCDVVAFLVFLCIYFPDQIFYLLFHHILPILFLIVKFIQLFNHFFVLLKEILVFVFPFLVQSMQVRVCFFNVNHILHHIFESFVLLFKLFISFGQLKGFLIHTSLFEDQLVKVSFGFLKLFPLFAQQFMLNFDILFKLFAM